MGYIATSTDGTHWTAVGQDPILSVVSGWTLTFDGSKFIAISNQGYEATSTDGVNWLASKHRKLCREVWSGIAAGGDTAVALSPVGTISVLNLAEQPISNIDIGYEVNVKPDGENWTTPVQLSPSVSWQSVAFDGTKFVALGGSGHISTSTDGVTWSTPTQSANLGSNSWLRVTYVSSTVPTNSGGTLSNKGLFFALGTHGHISTSTDGTTWTAATQPAILKANNREWGTLGTLKDTLFVISNGGAITRTGRDLSKWASQNSSTTTPAENATLASVVSCSVAYDGEKLVALERGGSITTSRDSVTWSSLTSVDNFSDKGYWKGLAYGNNTYVAVSTNGYISTSPDIKSSKIPIGGKSFRGDWQPCHYIALWCNSTTGFYLASNSYTIDLSTEGLLPDDGFDYEIQGSIEVVPPATQNTSVALGIETAQCDYGYIICCITRRKSNEVCDQSFQIVVPGYDRTVRIYGSTSSSRNSDAYVCISSYRRVPKQ